LTLKPFLLAALFVLFTVSGAGQAVALSSSSETGKQAVILSPLEGWMQTWNMETYLFLLQHAGYKVDVLLNEQVSISFLKAGLAKYDLIILRTDFINDESASYYCSGEVVTSDTASTFANEISTGELKIGVCLGFSSLFLRHYYQSNSLKPGLVYVLAGASAELSSALLDAGASVFVGYDHVFTLQWGRMDAFSQAFLKYLARGYSVEDAQVELRLYLIMGHGVTADWPQMRLIGDLDYKI